MTVKEFIQKWLGKKADWDKHYGGQCVDLFRFYVHEVLRQPQPRPVLGAWQFWANFDRDPNLYKYFVKIPNTPDFVPQEGDVAVWNRRKGRGYGHIAICTGRGNTSWFESFDQNWSRISYCELVKHNYRDFYGVLRPKKFINSKKEGMGNITIDTKLYEKLVGKATQRDDTWRFLGLPENAGFGDVKRKIEEMKNKIKDLEKALSEKETELGNRVEQVSRLKNTLREKEEVYNKLLQKHNKILAEVGTMQKTYDDRIKVLEGQLDTCSKEKGKMKIEYEKQIKSLKKETEELKTQVEDCKNGMTAELTVGDLLKRVIDKLLKIKI